MSTPNAVIFTPLMEDGKPVVRVPKAGEYYLYEKFIGYTPIGHGWNGSPVPIYTRSEAPDPAPALAAAENLATAAREACDAYERVINFSGAFDGKMALLLLRESAYRAARGRG